MQKTKRNKKKVNLREFTQTYTSEVKDKFGGVAKTQFKGFMNFLSQNSILALALGVIIGSATKDVVNQLVSGIITPIITIILSLFAQNLDLKSLNTEIRGVPVQFGDFLNSLLSMILIMLILYIVFGVLFRKQEALGIKEKANDKETK